MDPTTLDGVDHVLMMETLLRIDERLARLEHLISQYEPLLSEFSKRMKGPMAWRKDR